MEEERESEQLRYESERAQKETEPEKGYTPRTRYQIVLAWILLAVVLFAIGGMCYWQMTFKL